MGNFNHVQTVKIYVAAATTDCRKIFFCCVQISLVMLSKSWARPPTRSPLSPPRFVGSLVASLLGPHGLTLTWRVCYGWCLWYKPNELAHSFLFCSSGSSDCIPFYEFSRQLSVFSLCSSGPISLPYWSFQLYVSLWKSPSALIYSLVVDWAQNTNELTS